MVIFRRIHLAVCRVLQPGSTGLLSWALLAGGLLSGCGEDLVLPGDGESDEFGPADIRVVDGNGQSGEVGTLLTEPLVVLVTNAQGDPIVGATVEFELTSAGEGAEIEPATRPTGEDGRAEAHVILGDKVGLQTGEARVVTGTTAALKTSFTALARLEDPGNRPPEADFNWHCEGLSCQFTDASTDDDGNVTHWSWWFGDGGESEQTEPAHAYVAPGTYEVTLRVTDDDGATAESSTEVTVTAPSPPPEDNKSPKAEFEVHCGGLTCAFVDKSKDDDGAVVGWQWSFGDGESSSERNPMHTYDNAGKYDVLLIVTDDDGDIDAKTHRAEPKN